MIPTCDRPEWLSRCLERLAPGAQTLDASQYEVIVTDDARTRSAEAIVHPCFPWARWVIGPRRGPAANRNHGAQCASGEWLVFTDDDCVPCDDWLRAYARAMEMSGAMVLEGRTVATPAFRSVWDEAPENLRGGWFWSCNIAIRRELFVRLGGFDENYRFAAMEDVDLRRALAEEGQSITFVEGAEVNHPIRKVGPLQKLRQIGRLQSHVYYAQKWNAASTPQILGALTLLITRHWLLKPLRSGQTGRFILALLYPAMMIRMLCGFPGWVRTTARVVRRVHPRIRSDMRRSPVSDVFR